MGGFLGKYSRIIIGISMFLIIVLAVLGVSFLNTLQLEEDVELIEAAGHQAALSQRVSKSLLYTYNSYINGTDFKRNLDEVTSSSKELKEGLESLRSNKEALLIGEENIQIASQLSEPIFERINDIQIRLEEQYGLEQEGQAVVRTSLLELFDSVQISVKFLTQILGELAEEITVDGNDLSLGLLVELQDIQLQKLEEAVLLITRNYFLGLVIQQDIEELEKDLLAFDESVDVIENGGELSELSGKKVAFPAVTSERGLLILNELKSVYSPLRADAQTLLDLIVDEDARVSTPSLFVDILTFTETNINNMSDELDGLAQKATGLAEKASKTNEYIQIGGAIASALIFLYILSDFFGNLRRSDIEVELAQRESQQIFETVDQGLFLLNDETKIGGQYSKELVNIFGTEDIANKDLLRFLKDTVTEADLSKLTRYLKLLFDPKKKEKLIQDLNPLQQISVQVHEHGRISDKFLRFGFSRVLSEGSNKIESILTSVSDVTREALLQKQLDKAAKTNDQQVALLTTLLNTNTDLIPIFLRNSAASYDSMNAVMREDSKSSEEYKEKANQLGALIHKVKGESSALSIDVVTESCHEFEEVLEKINSMHHADGNSFLSLVVILEKLIGYNTLIDDLNDRVFSKKTRTASSDNKSTYSGIDRRKRGFDADYLFGYVDKIATRLNKKVLLKKSGLDAPGLPQSLTDALPAFSSQFIRNSIAHGIEDPSVRLEKGKPETGRISLNLAKTKSGYELDVFDDGAGIDENAVATRAINLGLVTKEEVASLSKQQMIALIFKPGFSTKDEVDEDSGRGMGMSAISTLITELKGRVSISTRVGEFTRFVIRFPMEAVEKKTA